MNINTATVPIFSIVIPTYNRPETFRRAVISAINQSFSSFEIIVVDDCSTEQYVNAICDTLGIACTIIINAKNSGVAASRNAGIAAARGRYISLLDDDDEYLSSFLQSTYEQLSDSDPSIGFSWCGANIYNYNAGSKVPGAITTKTFITDCEDKELLFDQLFSIGTGYGLTIKAECIRKIGSFDAYYRVVEDTDFFLRLLTAGFYPRIIPGIHIALHNQHQVRLTSSTMHGVRLREAKEMFKKYDGFFSQYPIIYKRCMDHLVFLEHELKQAVELSNA